MITARELIAAARVVDPDTPLTVVLALDTATLAEWGWDVDLDVRVVEVDAQPHRLTVTVTPL